MAQEAQDDDLRRGVSVAEAAAQLGMTPNAVRKRARRGWNLAHKGDDNEWRIIISQPDVTGDPTPSRDVPGIRRPTPHAAIRPVPLVSRGVPSAEQDEGVIPLLAATAQERDQLQAQVGALTTHNAALFAELSVQAAAHAAAVERADQERAELRRLLGNAQMQTAALITPSDSEVGQPNTPTPPQGHDAAQTRPPVTLVDTAATPRGAGTPARGLIGRIRVWLTGGVE